MDELVRWLGEHYDEDAARARAAAGRNWLPDGGWLINEDMHLCEVDDGPTLAHIAEHDPARVLREIDAKRQLLSLHSEGSSQLFCSQCEHEPPCPTLRLLALPYADRPGYREEWAP